MQMNSIELEGRATEEEAEDLFEEVIEEAFNHGQITLMEVYVLSTLIGHESIRKTKFAKFISGLMHILFGVCAAWYFYQLLLSTLRF